MDNEVVGIDRIIGLPVLARATGEGLGKVHDLLVDPVKGILRGITIEAPNGKLGGVDYQRVFSIGKDAVMVEDNASVTPIDADWVATHTHAKKHLIGAGVVTEGGNRVGEIADVFVRMTTPALVIYQLRGSGLGAIFGGSSYIYAVDAGALSGGGERLIVADDIMKTAAGGLSELLSRPLAVGGFQQR